MESIGWLDWAFVILLAAGVMVGFMWGVINVLSSIGGLVVGFLLAQLVAGPFASLLGNFIQNPRVAWMVAYFTSAMAISFVIWIAAAIFHFFIAKLHLKILDRLIGAGVGFALAAAATLIVGYFVHDNSDEKMRQAVANSRLMPYYFKVFDYMKEKEIDPAKQIEAVKEKAKGKATEQWHTVK